MNSIQGIFSRFGKSFSKDKILSDLSRKVMKAITSCRTELMGTLKKKCEECGYEEFSYRSCRNRHCPKCQTYAKEKWIIKRKSELLNVRYYHVVFTLPSELRSIALFNKERIFHILFKSVSETLKTLGLDNRWLGAEIGAMLILHTWTQTMLFHPHIHCVIPGGGITPSGAWKYGSQKFFIPVKVLAKVFRGKFMHFFLEELKAGNLLLPGKLTSLCEECNLKDFRINLYKKNWYVYCKRTFNGPEAVIEYLGRYSHRVCISDCRIVRIEDTSNGNPSEGQVTFSYRDSTNRTIKKEMTVSASEFLRRYLWHTLPSGFMKIRYIGILSNRNKSTKLDFCQRVTGSIHRAEYLRKITNDMILNKVSAGKAFICPACGCDKFTLADKKTTEKFAKTG